MKVYHDSEDLVKALLRNIKKYKPELNDLVEFQLIENISELDEGLKKTYGYDIRNQVFLKLNFNHEKNEIFHDYYKKFRDIKNKLSNRRAINNLSNKVNYLLTKLFPSIPVSYSSTPGHILDYFIINNLTYKTKYSFNFLGDETLDTWKNIINKLDFIIKFIYNFINEFDFDKQFKNFEKINYLINIFESNDSEKIKKIINEKFEISLDYVKIANCIPNDTYMYNFVLYEVDQIFKFYQDIVEIIRNDRYKYINQNFQVLNVNSYNVYENEKIYALLKNEEEFKNISPNVYKKIKHRGFSEINKNYPEGAFKAIEFFLKFSKINNTKYIIKKF